MSRFREELKVIPRAVRIIVAFVLFGLSSACTLFLMFSHDPDLVHTPRFGKLLMIVGVGIVPAIWVLLIGYVYADAKRRGMVSMVNSSGRQSGTSSQASGAETRASGVGRTEYAEATVRSFAFWL